MSEYSNVEKPFLDELQKLGWTVSDRGTHFPQNPELSFRSGFREIVPKVLFNEHVRRINVTEDGQEWLTDKQLDELYDSLLKQPGLSLREINENTLALLFRAQVDVNEVTGEEDPNVRLIDFEHPERNNFLAMNQFRVDTPGRTKSCIIPDITLFVNGIPLVVIECKDANQVEANPMHEAFKQLMRYTDQRPETHAAGLHEGEPRLFYTNQLLIRTCGERAVSGDN